MPKNDPSYVRLTERLSGSVLLDLNSSWSISGLDVQKFPDDKGAANFVRTKIRAGALEEASKAEFDEVESSKKPVSEEAGGFQEGKLQADAEQRRKKLTDARKKSKKEEEGEGEGTEG